LLSAGYELRGFELKGPGPRTDSHLFAKVARAALGLGNLRDGGHIVIGIDDTDPAAMGPGLDQQQLESWLDYDSVAQKLAVYADPPIRFHLAPRELASGAAVVVVEVAEFSDLPHLCAKEYEGVLRRGALYVRPRKMPETSEVASSIEMRDVIQLATEKALRAYVEVAERARVELSTAEVSDAEQFASQRDLGWQ
jgi:hypothetical protein